MKDQPPIITPPSQKATPPSKPKNRLRLVLLILVIIVIFVGLPLIGLAFLIGSAFYPQVISSSQCRTYSKDFFSKTQVITNQFNAIAVVPNQPDVKAEIQQHQGDCNVSKPKITGTRTFLLATTAGIAIDEATTALKYNGYKAETDAADVWFNPCSSTSGSYTFYKNNDEVTITLTCSSESAGNNSAWRQIPVTKLTADLVAPWSFQNY